MLRSACRSGRRQQLERERRRNARSAGSATGGWPACSAHRRRSAPAGFHDTGSASLGANDLLASGELFGPGVGHIHTSSRPRRVRAWGFTENRVALQLPQQRDFLNRLHGRNRAAPRCWRCRAQCRSPPAGRSFLPIAAATRARSAPRDRYSAAPRRRQRVFKGIPGRFYPPAGRSE